VILVANRQRIPVDVGRVRQTVLLALRALGVADHEVSLTLVDDRRVRVLNARYRGVSRATDVLAFPLAGPARRPGGPPPVLGDAVISVEAARRQARRLGHSLWEELDLLCCHACLHLVGYDDRDPLEARLMHAREMSLLGRLYRRPVATLHVRASAGGGLTAPSRTSPGRDCAARVPAKRVRARSGTSGPRGRGGRALRTDRVARSISGPGAIS
jgi:probable rRNA maturation factor